MNIPVHSINVNSTKIAGGHGYLAVGNKGGFVKLFNAGNDFALIKTFDQLTTEITDLCLNDKYVCFASKWKKNCVRIAMLDSLKVLPGWPNIKTNLNIVNRVMIDDKDRILFGNSLGTVHVYQLLNN